MAGLTADELTNGKVIGVFGGTFDPPHLGHLILASEAAEQLGLETILWVPTRQPPHKLTRRITPIEIRLQLLEAALAGDDRFLISRVEIDRSPPYYAVETLRLLKVQQPGVQFAYLMGGDSLHDLPNWRSPIELAAQCIFLGVYRRPNDAVNLADLESRIPGVAEKIAWINAPLIDISSSMVREKARSGGVYRYYVPEGVARLIAHYHLYQENHV